MGIFDRFFESSAREVFLAKQVEALKNENLKLRSQLPLPRPPPPNVVRVKVGVYRDHHDSTIWSIASRVEGWIGLREEFAETLAEAVIDLDTETKRATLVDVSQCPHNGGIHSDGCCRMCGSY